MRTEINPQETTRATAFELWMSSPMPMVTLVKTLDVSHMIKYCRRNHLSFNMMMCWCIGKAASQIPEFFSLPQDNKMYRFSRLAIGPVVANSEGGINYCDIPYSDSIQQFSADYRSICSKAAAMCENICLDKEKRGRLAASFLIISALTGLRTVFAGLMTGKTVLMTGGCFSDLGKKNQASPQFFAPLPLVWHRQ